MYIFPKPSEYGRHDGYYMVNKKIKLTISRDFKNEKGINLFCELWNNFTFGISNVEVLVADIENTGAYLSLEGYDKIESVGEFEYKINVTEKGIYISYSCENGLIHAFATILQMIQVRSADEGAEKITIPFCTVCDKPILQFRGIHICVFPETKLIFLKKLVRLIGMAKYSHVVLEFWGTLKYDAMKELSWKTAFTKEQIKPIIAEANALGVEVIPMFNHLGHAAMCRGRYGKHVVLDQNPKKAPLFEPDGWTWCVSNPVTLKLLGEIRQELIELCGEGEYFHLGCDEAHSFATCDICEKENSAQLFADYINTLSADLKKYNRKAIMWGDNILDKTAWEGSIATGDPKKGMDKVLQKLDKSIVIDDWQYYIKEPNLPTAAHFATNGFEVILSPWDENDNIKALTYEAIDKNYKGIMATTWNTLHEHMALILYASELSWSGINTRNDIVYPDMYSAAAALQRKLLPVNGNYTDAGWNEIDETLC